MAQKFKCSKCKKIFDIDVVVWVGSESGGGMGGITVKCIKCAKITEL